MLVKDYLLFVAKITEYGITNNNGRLSKSEATLQIEMEAIRRGGKWERNDQSFGLGLSYHFGQMRKIIWPELDDEEDGQRWHKLCRDEISQNRITTLMGCGSSGKTHEASWIYLCDYWCFPEETCVLVSSTDIRGLKKRVWGEMVSLWERGIERFDFLAGHLLDSSIAITTDDIQDGEDGELKARDMRKGIFGIPCVQGGKFVGLSKFIGIKQKRMRLVADEASAMDVSFLSAFANLNKNEDFKATILGNPNDPLDPLGRAAEPKEGWTDAHLEPTKTTVWVSRFMNGRTVNLIGLDSPNFDFPPDQPTRFKYLISKEKIADTLSFFPKDSVEYYSQCVGSMKVGTMAKRVLTRAECQKNGALGEPIWIGTEAHTRIAFLDSSWGGDRACLMGCEMGMSNNGEQLLNFTGFTIIPISVKSETQVDDQIAQFCRQWCEQREISPQNFFHDSTGRGTLGTALARNWSDKCNPVEFGGKPTERPVSLDLFIYDDKTQMRRLKRCDEHYIKFVTELWFSVRYAVLSEQIRGLPSEAMEEFCLRQWDRTKEKNVLETKEEMKERVGRSPDIADAAAGCVEGARRLGFQIKKMQVPVVDSKQEDWFDKEADEWNDAIKSGLLKH